jgi:hypothetical protein
VHEFLTGRAGTDERLSDELVNVLVMLVRAWLGVTEPLDGGPAGGLQVCVNVGPGRVREACGHASHTGPDEVDPDIVFRMPGPWRNGHASWLPRFCIVHVT